MTTLCTSLDASAALLAELRGDPRYAEPDAPAPHYIARLREATDDLYLHAAAAATTGDQP